MQAITTRLKDKVNFEKNEARACVSSAQRISDQSNTLLASYSESRVKITQLSKQKDSMERSFKNEIQRLRLENEKLLDKLRYKSGWYNT